MNGCIQKPELSDFVDGRLPEERAEAVAQHVDDCEQCQDTVVALSGRDDTFVVGLRDGETPESMDRGPAFQHGLQRLLHRAISGAPTTHDTRLPERIGPYVIERKLGDGGMGTVYLARHSKLKRTVALKILPSHRWSNKQAIARFEREMEAIGGLDHPHIVRASDAGEDDGLHYLVMEFVDGLDLSRVVRRLGRLSAPNACELARQASCGLQHAHDRGLVHRDIKPSNLMLARDQDAQQAPRLKILDLGLALLGAEERSGDHDVTTVGALMGTLDYMSPEQGIDSHSVDHRADIYGLGATLFKLLTGRVPYDDQRFGTLMKKMTALATKAAPSVAEFRPDLPVELVRVVDRMLARDPDDRFQNAREVAEALEELSRGSDLKGLLSEAEMATDPQVQAPATGNHEAATSPLDLQANAQTSRGTRGPGWWIGLASAFAAFLLGVFVYRYATDVGDLMITSNDPGLQVLLKQNDRVTNHINLEEVPIEGTEADGIRRVRIRAGKYKIEVVGKNAEISVFPKDIEVVRSQPTDLPISQTKLTASGDGEAATSPPGKTSASQDDPAPLATTTATYKVQPGDVLGVYIPGVLGNTEEGPPIHKDDQGPAAIGFPISVRNNGEISLPYIDPISVSGNDVAQLEKILRKAYTIDKQVLRPEAPILVSVLRTQNQAMLTRGSQSPLSSSVAGPRYEGRTLQQWLDEVKHERSRKQLVVAIKAMSTLSQHPENARLGGECMDAIMTLFRQFGTQRDDGSFHAGMMGGDMGGYGGGIGGNVAYEEDSDAAVVEHAWFALWKMPPEQLADRVVRELREGNRRSREAMLHVWMPKWSSQAFNQWDTGLDFMARYERLKREVCVRKPEVFSALTQIDSTYAVQFLHAMHQQGLKKEMKLLGAETSFEDALSAESKYIRALSVYYLSHLRPELPGLGEESRALLADPRVDKAFDTNMDPFRESIACVYLSLRAMERLKGGWSRTDLILQFLERYGEELDGWNMQFVDVPHWSVSQTAQGGMGGAGGGGHVQATKPAANFRPVILRILQSDGLPKGKLPRALVHYNFYRSHRAPFQGWEKFLIECDPELEQPIVMLRNKPGAKPGDDGWFDAFAKKRLPSTHIPDEPPKFEATGSAGRAATLAYVLRYAQKQIDTSLTIVPDKFHFSLKTDSSAKVSIQIVWPVAAFQCVHECVEHIEKEIAKWQRDGKAGSLIIELDEVVEACISRRPEPITMPYTVNPGGMF